MEHEIKSLLYILLLSKQNKNCEMNIHNSSLLYLKSILRNVTYIIITNCKNEYMRYLLSDVIAYHSRVHADKHKSFLPIVNYKSSGKRSKMKAIPFLFHFSISQLKVHITIKIYFCLKPLLFSFIISSVLIITLVIMESYHNIYTCNLFSFLNKSLKRYFYYNFLLFSIINFLSK